MLLFPNRLVNVDATGMDTLLLTKEFMWAATDVAYVVTEVCPCSGVKNKIHGRDTDWDDFTAYCSQCGRTMMLCNECLYTEDIYRKNSHLHFIKKTIELSGILAIIGFSFKTNVNGSESGMQINDRRIVKCQILYGVKKEIVRNWELYLFILPAVIYFFIFHYMPMYGVQIAFKDFTARMGIEGSKWVGLKHFKRFFDLYSCWSLITNTLTLSMYSLLSGFPLPILLALLLNEMHNRHMKKLVQTVSYAPHFISTVVLVSMISMFGNAHYGIFNKIRALFGMEAVSFMGVRGYFSHLYVWSGVWQNIGWNAIVFLSALTAIDPELHESAMIDGANRLQRIWHINIPCILPTVMMMFILQTGNLMSVGFEKVYLMQNDVNLDVSEVISTYVYKVGLLQVQFSFSTAVGLMNSVVNCILLVTVNTVSRKLTSTGLF